jgi:hypothetical protein
MAADVLVDWMVDRAIADSVVGTKTQGRVYLGHAGTIPNPIYPLVTISRLTPGDRDTWNPIEQFDLLISAYSERSAEEAWVLCEGMETLFDGEYAKVTGKGWRIRPTSTPVQDVDDTAGLVFFCHSIFSVVAVG